MCIGCVLALIASLSELNLANVNPVFLLLLVWQLNVNVSLATVNPVFLGVLPTHQ